MSILIYVKKSTIWAQSRLCASNRLEMPLVWSWSCTFKNGKKRRIFSPTIPSMKWSQILPKDDSIMRIAPLVSSWAPVLQSHGSLVRFQKRSSPLLHAMTQIYHFYHNLYPSIHLLVEINKPNLQSLNWIEDCFFLFCSS